MQLRLKVLFACCRRSNLRNHGNNEPVCEVLCWPSVLAISQCDARVLAPRFKGSGANSGGAT